MSGKRPAPASRSVRPRAAAALAPLALTMGEPAGIGGEIALKAWARRRRDRLPPFFLIDDPGRLGKLAKRLGLIAPLALIATPAEARAAFANALPVLAQTLAKTPRPGKPDPANAPAVLASLDRAIAFAQSGSVAGIVTNPIHKATLYRGGFRHPGHTEYLAARVGGTATMMLAVPGLRVVLVSIHHALRDAIAGLTTEAIVAAGRAAARALAIDFAIDRPRLVVAALNPHAGEDGALGSEESRIIAPAVAQLKALGIDARGPLAADTLFHAEARRRYDAVLCMYHDQALIPLKTIDFDHGVNVTLGLDIVRTSPDHGTALDIAGKNRAKADSLIAAIKLAAEIAANRLPARSRGFAPAQAGRRHRA